MFDILRTCIIGESFRACGCSYHPEDALETRHASEFDDNGADATLRCFESPEHFLESLCSSNAGRVYDTIREMERIWVNFSGEGELTPAMELLWDLGNSEASQYVRDNYGEEAAFTFLERGGNVFAPNM